MPDDTKQPNDKTMGQLWGLVFLAGLFGMGGYRLTAKGFTLFEPDTAYVLFYGLLLILGAAKGEFLFRRQFIARTLARGRQALGETGWKGDYLLAPFCMLSLYRPWQKKHMIVSWVLIPAMVTLAIVFVVADIYRPLKGAADLGVGLALVYGALIYGFYLIRLLSWWAADGRAETNPLPMPSRELRLGSGLSETVPTGAALGSR